MSERICLVDLPVFDPALHLKDERDIAEYLALVIAEGDADELNHALKIAARARQYRIEVETLSASESELE